MRNTNNTIPFMINETIYGSKKRLDYILENLKSKFSVLEFGCGTGYMITIQLLEMGYNIKGCDLDKVSIELGKKILSESGYDPSRLICMDISLLDEQFDVIIVSEVLEHIETKDLDNIISLLKSKLKDDGLLIVTVPNGYGWFELENFLWNKCKLGNILSLFWIPKAIGTFKRIIFRKDLEPKYPNSLDHSPHVQRFTHDSIQKLLTHNGLIINKITGSVLFAGLFSNLFFTGFSVIMKINNKLGSIFPKIASGFFLLCSKKI